MSYFQSVFEYIFHIFLYELKFSVLPNTHFSDKHFISWYFFPGFSPIQIFAWRKVLHIFPPDSCISSISFLQGGWLVGDTNITGWFEKRFCWYFPVDSWRWSMQIYIWGKKKINNPFVAFPLKVKLILLFVNSEKKNMNMNMNLTFSDISENLG